MTQQTHSSPLGTLKNLIRPAYHKARWIQQRLRNVVPSLPVSAHQYKLVRLGTDYGGWIFADEGSLRNGVIISCGLGEDGSFDVEFAARYNAKVIMVDPTPRAIAHFNGIASNIGRTNTAPYSKSGAQPVGAYDLSAIPAGHIELVDKALWNESTQLRFFSPKNQAHVSHSIVNYQNNYAATSDYITVQAITIDELLATAKIDQLSLIKLDIEGAEVEVLQDMLSKHIYPKQVLVEYDELSFPSKKSKARIEATHRQLLSAGYTLINREGINFLYIHST